MDLLKMLYYGLLGVCLVALLFNFKKLGRTYYWFIPLIILSITVQVFGDILKNYNIKGYSFIFHLYIPVEYSLMALFYFSLLHNKWVKRAILFSIVILLLFSVSYYSSNYLSFYGADFMDFCIEAAFVCTWIILFFTQLLKSEENFSLTSYPAFWINAANLLFYGGCLVIMGFNFYLHQRDEKLADQLFEINHYLNLLLYFMYIIAFICPVNWKKS